MPPSRSKRTELIGGHWGRLADERPLLTRDRERELLEAVVAGRPDDAGDEAKAASKAARDLLVESNVRYVLSYALRFKEGPVGFDDIVSEGVIGLIDAIDRYDPSRGASLLTYATYRIRSRINTLFAESGGVTRLPKYLWHACQSGCRERKPAAAENVRKARLTRSRVGLEKEDGQPRDDLLSSDVDDPSYRIAARLESEKLARALARLDVRTEYVLLQRYGFDDGGASDLSEIGANLDLCPERVRQIENAGLAALRGYYAEV